MNRYAVAIKNGCKVRAHVIEAKSPQAMKLKVFKLLEDEGIISSTNIIDDKMRMTQRPEKKVKVE